MKVRVLFFAQLRELSGEAERFVETAEGTTAGELADRLLRRPGGLLAMTDPGALGTVPLLFAVNENFVCSDEKLRDRDVLALMTPVSGG
ncbi:MAG: MoaD/ThiS family protein [Candidatus Omnitrophota bacterium]